MKAFVVDDTPICLERTVEVLRIEGWDVDSVLVDETNRDSFRISSLNAELPYQESLKASNLVVTDLELGKSINTWGFVCAVRAQFPSLPVVLLTGAHFPWEDFKKLHQLKAAGIHYVDKGRDFNSDIYPKAGKRILRDLISGWGKGVNIPKDNPIIPPDDPAWFDKGYIPSNDPRLNELLPPLWSDIQAGSVDNINEVMQEVMRISPRTNEEAGAHRLSQLQAIVRLKDKGVRSVPCKEYFFSIDEPGPLTHEIGHALCDGVLTPEVVEPFLPDLRVVLGRISYFVEKDERFRPCADFILNGRLVSDLPMILGMY